MAEKLNETEMVKSEKFLRERIRLLIEKGVRIPSPLTVEIGEEVCLHRISGKDVVIHAGCRIHGEKTLIMSGTELGYEAPVTIWDCQIGRNVKLKGGFFCNSVFLEDANMGYGAHVRDACILEEQANGAHVVGLKHTILFPFVTLGSLINFCDCLMAGGTSRRNHSEVGSSYIHFNYTPNQDKATASLIGDVPRGVMLNQKPIFLGGQGGLVGPRRLEFGTTIAAGTTWKKDELRPGRLLSGKMRNESSDPFDSRMYQKVEKIVINNIIYIANLIALMQWYIHVRSQFISEHFPEELFDALKEKLDWAINERIENLTAFCIKMSDPHEALQRTPKKKASPLLLQQRNELHERQDELDESLKDQRKKEGEQVLRDTFLERIHKRSGKDYISVIQGLDSEDIESGTRWLQGIVDHITNETLQIIPSFGPIRK